MNLTEWWLIAMTSPLWVLGLMAGVMWLLAGCPPLTEAGRARERTSHRPEAER